MTAMHSHHGVTCPEPGCSDCTDGSRAVATAAKATWRDRIRAKRGAAQAWRVCVFLAGLLFVALGFALSVLPGPLTIPPVLFGLWIWSTEFTWARRFFDAFKEKANQAWEHAKRHPVSSALITVGGLAAAGVAFWAVGHYSLIERARQLIGL